MHNLCAKFSNRNVRERNTLEDIDANGENIKMDVWKRGYNHIN